MLAKLDPKVKDFVYGEIERINDEKVEGIAYGRLQMPTENVFFAS